MFVILPYHIWKQNLDGAQDSFTSFIQATNAMEQENLFQWELEIHI